MNLGDNRWHRKYICDKCKEPIPYIVKEGILKHSYYKAIRKAGTNVKDFDLCDTCEKEFREWLNERPILTPKRMINKFPVYQEK